MAKRSKALLDTGERAISAKFRTTPITSTIKTITGLPRSAILYKCEASSYWQFRVFLEGKPRKRSTKQEDFAKAQREAKLIYSDMLNTINGEESKRQPSSRKTLQQIAVSLWAKNNTRIKNGEVHKDKVAKDTYVFERHIKPFFSGYDIKDIDAEALDEFKANLAEKELSAATQASYIQIVMSLLKEAQIKRYISHLPPKPRIRVDDEVRGYFDERELDELTTAAYRASGQVYDFKTTDGKVYRKTKITDELPLLIRFMLTTFIRPTDVAVLKHRHVYKVRRNGIDFIELRHPTTKRHRNHMLGTEGALTAYLSVKEYQNDIKEVDKEDFIFQPLTPNRETALEALSTQFTALLEIANLRKDAEGKPRALYSLRHTAIVHAIHKGLPIAMIASNARTSTEMIIRFYGSHVKSALNQGTVFVDTERAIRNQRYEKTNDLAKEIGVEFDAYEEDPEGDAQRRKELREMRIWEREQKRAGMPEEVKAALALINANKDDG